MNILSFLRRRRDLRCFGEWAIITGSTDGIGKAMAIQLAQKKMKLLLISRSAERLKATADEIKTLVPGLRAVDYLVVDYSEGTTDQLFNTLSDAVKNLDVGILVNNVGISYPCPLFYDELDIKLIEDLINVNVRSTLITTRAVYPGMVKRKRGAIVCIGSGSSAIPSDYLYCAYSATKGAQEAFCKSLRAECTERNIVVQCQVPLLVTSKLAKTRKATFTTPTPHRYAKSAIRAIETADIQDDPCVSPYWVHSLVIWLANELPLWVWDKLNYSRVAPLRRRALLKRPHLISGNHS